MECPKCGFAMGPFDVECERCKRMARQQATQPQAPPAAKQIPPSMPATHSQPQPPRPSPSSPATTSTSPWGYVALGVMVTLGALAFLGARLGGVPAEVKRLDGQHVSYEARLVTCQYDGLSFTGTIELGEGPSRG